MKHYPHPKYAKEGWLYIAISVIVALLVMWFTNVIAALPFILIALFVIQFFRDPAREIPEDVQDYLDNFNLL